MYSRCELGHVSYNTDMCSICGQKSQVCEELIRDPFLSKFIKGAFFSCEKNHVVTVEMVGDSYRASYQSGKYDHSDKPFTNCGICNTSLSLISGNLDNSHNYYIKTITRIGDIWDRK